ncbi:TetR/AcrR family transcriptional regulator [Paenibacillus nasutitermitis]|uniref:TetR family transcriptional regulator n=1 Tax=Paenibacillus nasutitermitis TaxID=1652958 RepID=A0A916Z8V0_9BACL|nr:TetR/AcrR family transcriptional regulator [Paenibacillus nasutitermitis]GGD81660.1 TetR family transcriptional regulator [Paenibacillus nasutitermitis]
MSKSGRPREFKDKTVIEAAMEVFWTNGYEACSTEDLCKQTGLGRGSLYNAFGSKHELYEHALLRYHEAGIQAQIEILEKQGLLKDRLRALLNWAIQEDFSNEGRRGCLLINAAMERAQRDPAVERIFKQHVELLEQAIRKAIEIGRNAGEISQQHQTSELASMFLSSYYGLRVLNAAVQNREMAAHIVEGTLASFF